LLQTVVSVSPWWFNWTLLFEQDIRFTTTTSFVYFKCFLLKQTKQPGMALSKTNSVIFCLIHELVMDGNYLQTIYLNILLTNLFQRYNNFLVLKKWFLLPPQQFNLYCPWNRIFLYAVFNFFLKIYSSSCNCLLKPLAFAKLLNIISKTSLKCSRKYQLSLLGAKKISDEEKCDSFVCSKFASFRPCLWKNQGFYFATG